MSKVYVQKQPMVIDLGRLHELYMAGVDPGEIADQMGWSESHINTTIRRERQKHPEKWPERKRGVKRKTRRTRKDVPVLQATYPPPPAPPPVASPVITRPMTEEERKRYGIHRPPRNNDGELIKAPVMIRNLSTERSESCGDGLLFIGANDTAGASGTKPKH